MTTSISFFFLRLFKLYFHFFILGIALSFTLLFIGCGNLTSDSDGGGLPGTPTQTSFSNSTRSSSISTGNHSSSLILISPTAIQGIQESVQYKMSDPLFQIQSDEVIHHLPDNPDDYILQGGH